MSPSLLHILFAHVPIVGGFLAMLLLIFSYSSEDESIKRSALSIILVAVAGMFVSYLFADGARQVVEVIPGAPLNLIEQHAKSSYKLLFIGAVLFLLTAYCLFYSWKNEESKSLNILAVLFSVAIFEFFLITVVVDAHKISHASVRSGGGTASDIIHEGEESSPFE